MDARPPNQILPTLKMTFWTLYLVHNCLLSQLTILRSLKYIWRSLWKVESYTQLSHERIIQEVPTGGWRRCVV